MPPPIPTIPSPRNDQIIGTSADDIIDALAGNDVVRAGDGDDVVRGNLGNDKLFGEDGADRLSGDQGNDNIDGGDGLDTAVYTGSRDDYQVTTDANGVTEVKDLRGQGSKTPDGIDHVVNTEFFDFNGDVFQLEPGFAGNTVHYQAYILNLSTPYPFASNGDFLVGDSIEVSNIIDGLATLNITNDTLIFDFNSSFNFVNYPFVGSVLSDTADNLPEITDVYIIENDVTGFELSDISHDANNVYVNFAGASGNAASHIVLGVDFV